MRGNEKRKNSRKGKSKTQALRVEKWKNRVRGRLTLEGEGKIMQREWKGRRHDKQH